MPSLSLNWVTSVLRRYQNSVDKKVSVALRFVDWYACMHASVPVAVAVLTGGVCGRYTDVQAMKTA